MKPMDSEEFAHRAAPFTNRSRDYTSISSAEAGIRLHPNEESTRHAARLTVIEHSADLDDAAGLLEMLGLDEPSGDDE